MKSNSTWHFVCELDDILPDAGVAALLDGKQIASYDGYAKQVEPGLIKLGERELAAGKHRIQARAALNRICERTDRIERDRKRIGAGQRHAACRRIEADDPAKRSRYAT